MTPPLRSTLRIAVPALLATSAAAYENGAPPGHTGGFGEDSCHACHSDSPIDGQRGRLTVTGVPELYRPGTRYELVLTLEHPALETGGFQLSLRTSDGRSAGRLEAASPRVASVTSDDGVCYLQHTSAGREAGAPGAIRWSFAWYAPDDPGPVTLHAAANAANDDLSALGDFVFTLARRLAAVPDAD